MDSASPPTEAVSGLSALDCAQDEDEESRDPPPLIWYKTTEERHERIAYRLSSVVDPCQVPYVDFVPFPGSGPGSPALSNATNTGTPSDAAERTLPPPPLPLDTALPQQAPNYSPRLREEADSNLTLTRYLADLTEPQEWLAVVLRQGSQPPDGQPDAEARQETPVSSITLSGGTAARNAVGDNDDSNSNRSESHNSHGDYGIVNSSGNNNSHDNNGNGSAISVDDNAGSYYPEGLSQRKRPGSYVDTGDADEDELGKGGGESSSRPGVRLGGVLTYEQIMTKRSERVFRNNLQRTVRNVRMRNGSSPPHKRPRTG